MIIRGATYTNSWREPSDIIAESAVLRLAVGGARREYPLTKAAGIWNAKLAPADTTNLPAGEAIAELAFTDGSGDVVIVWLESIKVEDSLTANSAITDAPQSLEAQTLAAAKQALLTASGDASVSFSTPGGQSYSFETRGELLTFVNRLERKVNPRSNLMVNLEFA